MTFEPSPEFVDKPVYVGKLDGKPISLNQLVALLQKALK